MAKDYTDEGIVLQGDFEDDAYGWSLYDADGDATNWNLGTNMWGTYYEDGWYTHSGAQCLASASDLYAPDNWTFSPIVSVPANGADLSYWVAAFSPYNWLEHYSFYITDANTFQTNTDPAAAVEAIKAGEALIEETMEEAQGARDGWLERTFSLDQYAGKDIVLCFRHHNTTGQYLLRLDDVIVKKKSGETAIQSIEQGQQVTSREVCHQFVLTLLPILTHIGDGHCHRVSLSLLTLLGLPVTWLANLLDKSCFDHFCFLFNK